MTPDSQNQSENGVVYTPGPWAAERAVDDLGYETGKVWIIMRGQPMAYDFDKFEDAQLAAAAPDLLEACMRIRAEKAPSYHDCIDNGEPECAWCAVFNAIAKATQP